MPGDFADGIAKRPLFGKVRFGKWGHNSGNDHRSQSSQPVKCPQDSVMQAGASWGPFGH